MVMNSDYSDFSLHVTVPVVCCVLVLLRGMCVVPPVPEFRLPKCVSLVLNFSLGKKHNQKCTNYSLSFCMLRRACCYFFLKKSQKRFLIKQVWSRI